MMTLSLTLDDADLMRNLRNSVIYYEFQVSLQWFPDRSSEPP